MSSTTVLIVEDHAISRLGLRMVLEEEPDLAVVGEAADGLAAVELALSLKPAVVLMDIGLPGLDGIEATRQIKSQLAEARVLMITSHESDADIFAAFAAGADGYCLKDASSREIVVAVKAVASGASWLHSGIASRVLAAASGRASGQVPSDAQPLSLSDREMEVLALVVAGLSNQQIAQKLMISVETVKTHLRRIMEKLHVSDRTQAAVKALRLGLVNN